MNQFMKAANTYFVVITFMQTWRSISITNGTPFMLYPLIVITSVSMIKDAYEDYKRHKNDNRENNMLTQVYQQGGFRQIEWKNVRVG